MVSIKFEPGDRVRVVKGDEEDLPVGFETTVTATSVEEYGVKAGTQFLDLLDAAGDPRCRPAHEFELVPRSVIDAREHEARTLVEWAYDLAGTPRTFGKLAELGMAYGTNTIREAHNALVDRVAVLEAQLRSPAKHEQPPVDRATEITREAVAIWHETLHLSGEAEPDNELASLARRGELDDRKDFIRVRQYLASLLAEQSNG